MAEVELIRTCVKLSKQGKILQIIGEILVPIGLIVELMLFVFYPTVITLLVPLVVAVIGFILHSSGEALQVDAREQLANYYKKAEFKVWG